MNKTTAYTILGIITGVIIVALAIFYFMFMKTPTTGPDIGPEVTNEGTAGRGGFGGTGSTSTTTPNNPGGAVATTTESRPTPPVLRKISAGPIAGGIAYDVTTKVGKTSTTTTSIRFMDRINGAIYETRTDVLDTQKIASASIQKVREAFWAKDGASVYVRYTTDANPYTIETYLAKLVPSKTATSSQAALPSEISFLPQEVRGSYLTRNLAEVIPSPFTLDTVFYTLQKGADLQGIISSKNDTKRVEVLNSPITEWSSQWLASNVFAITTKASNFSDGFMYFLNTDTQKLDRILGNVRGLTAIASTDQKYVIYSNSKDDGFSTRLLDTKNGSVEPFSFTVLPEKCVWSKKQVSIVYCAVPQYLPSGFYPDSWYQGMIGFTDDIWKIDASTGSTKLLASLTTTSKEEIDVIRPFLDTRENYLFFTNKKDGAFWSLLLPILSSNK
ncbi:MAG: hypothetical protein WCO79_00150 [bacterium]